MLIQLGLRAAPVYAESMTHHALDRTRRQACHHTSYIITQQRLLQHAHLDLIAGRLKGPVVVGSLRRPADRICSAEQGVMAAAADTSDFNAKLWSQNLSAVLDRNRDMAACRKLKQDIEQTLKKVADGILLFNEFNKKMEESQVRSAPILVHPCMTDNTLQLSMLDAC